MIHDEYQVTLIDILILYGYLKLVNKYWCVKWWGFMMIFWRVIHVQESLVFTEICKESYYYTKIVK